MNIARHLPALAQERPDQDALVAPSGERRTFRRLDANSDALAHGLRRAGIARGTRTVLMVPPSLEMFELVFALFKAGAVPVLIDPGMGTANLKTCIDEARPEAFIGVPKAHVARLLFGWGKGRFKTLITAGPRLFWGGRRLKDLYAPGAPLLEDFSAEETAAVLFTSGSTGIPKGAVYTHAVFEAQVECLKNDFGIEPGGVDLPTFPLFALFLPALGLSAVIPDMDFTRPAKADPVKLIRAIETHDVSSMFGSPALLDTLSRHLEARQKDLPSLKRVISAGAPVPAQVLERLRRHLPNAEIHTPYGATEALPVTDITAAEILGGTAERTAKGAGVCVGKPVRGVEVRVIEISDLPIRTLEDAKFLDAEHTGEIVVKGPQVTKEYFGRPKETGLSKIADPRGGFWHRMGDVGYFDAEGRLWFCGRKAHRVDTPQGVRFTVPVESIFNTHRKVVRTALVGIPKGAFQEPVLCVELDKKARRERPEAIRTELYALGATHELTKDIRTILFHTEFPVDIRHNAKIFREKLAVWAAGEVHRK